MYLPPYKTSNTEFTPPSNLPNDKEYFWRVKATDQNGNETVVEHRPLLPRSVGPGPQAADARPTTRSSSPTRCFSWEPVPGAEQYQIQIDDTNQFAGILLADEKIYNVTTYAHPDWSSVPIAFDAYWRVRAIDASNNYTPWSETRSFRTGYTVAPDPIYPPYSFAPDTQNLPVHRTPHWPGRSLFGIPLLCR